MADAKNQKPCQRTGCPSFGRAHPNCKCWGGGYSKGGVVKSMHDVPHEDKCGYFEGGKVFDKVEVVSPDGLNGHIPANQLGFALNQGYTMVESKESESILREFLGKLNPNTYEYKDEFKDNPLAGEGTFVSPMAQELEQTDLGKSMVQDTPDGKVVDYGKGFGAMLAAQADLQKRIDALEKKKGKK